MALAIVFIVCKYQRMDKITHAIERVENYAAKVGTTPDLVFRAATGNPRLYQRLLRRIADLDDIADKVVAYIDNGKAVGK